MCLSRGGGWLTGADITFFAIVAVMVAGRWLEFRGVRPLTATGEPATPRDLRRYAIGAFALCLAIWVVAALSR